MSASQSPQSPYGITQVIVLPTISTSSPRTLSTSRTSFLPRATASTASLILPSYSPVNSLLTSMKSPRLIGSKSLSSISAMSSKYSPSPYKRLTTFARERLLVTCPAPLSSVRGDMLIDAAMEKNNTQVCQQILDDISRNRPHVDSIHSVHGLTPLMAACKWSRPRTVQLLLDYGAYADFQRPLKMDTALHVAAQSGSTKCVAALLQAGANHEVFDKAGMTPLDYTSEHPENNSVASLLWSVPARPTNLHVMEEEEEEEDKDKDAEEYQGQNEKVSVTLVWSPPFCNGAKIESSEIDWYRLDVNDHEGTVTVQKHDNDNDNGIYSNGRAVITDLIPMVPYRFCVRSKNQIGWSVRSDSQDYVTKSSIPHGMSSPTIVRQTSSLMVLEWAPPISDNGQVVDRYEIEVKYVVLSSFSNNTMNGTLLDATAAVHIFSRITPLTTYQVPVLSKLQYKYWFRIRAHNRHGWSSYSPLSSGVETLDTCAATVETAHTIRVVWPRVVGAAKYQIQAAMSSSKKNLLVKTSALQWEILQEDVPVKDANVLRPFYTLENKCIPATYYVFRILDYHELFGWSAGAKSEVVKTKTFVPDRPEAPTLQTAAPMSLNLVTLLKRANGENIDAFEISYRCQVEEQKNEKQTRLSALLDQKTMVGETSVWFKHPTFSVSSNHRKLGVIKTRIKDLEIFQSYVFRARCRNICGWSHWSESTSSFQTTACVPDPPAAPTIIQIEENFNRAITFTWNAAESHGAALEKYHLQIFHLGLMNLEDLETEEKEEMAAKERPRSNSSDADADADDDDDDDDDSDDDDKGSRSTPLELIESLFHVIDEDNDHFISKEEIIQAFLPGERGSQKAKDLIAEIMAITEESTDNADISIVDIRCLGLLLHPAMYRVAFRKMDTDTSGYISKDELLRFCSERAGWKHVETVDEDQHIFTVKNLQAGHGYRLRVLAVNSVGESVPSSSTRALVPCEVPTAPPAPTLVCSTTTNITINFLSCTDDGGTRVKEYEIARRIGTPDSKKTNPSYTEARKESINRLLIWNIVGTVPCPNPHVLPLEFEDRMLVPGSEYEYSIRAVNDIGAGQWSATSVTMYTKTKKPSFPSAPVLSSAPGSTSISLQWLAPAGTKQHIRLRYDISMIYVQLEDVENNRDLLLEEWNKVQSKNIADRDYTPGKIPKATITGVLAGASVQFKVRAKNYNGVGDWGLLSAVVTTCASTPDPVPSPFVEFMNERQIGVKWPRSPCRGDPITMYELQHLIAGRSWESMGNWKTELRTSKLFYCVPNLLPASAHNFRIRAYNSLGWGCWSVQSASIKTLADVPAIPQAPYMLKWDGETITFAWQHKGLEKYDNDNFNGEPLIHYEIQRLEERDWEEIGFSRPTDRHFSYLESKPVVHSRKFRVRAVNSKGPSDWSKGSPIFHCRRIFPEPKEEEGKKKKAKSNKKKL